MIYVNVAVNNKSKYTDSLFTYRAPEEVRVGDHALSQSGSHDTAKEGIVCQCGVRTELAPDKVKEIEAVIRPGLLTEEMVKTALWMKQRYGVKYYDAFRCFTVKGSPPREGKAKEPYRNVSGSYKQPQALTAEQQEAAGAVCSALEKGEQASFLLHGVTASGKTQVYMEAIAKAIALGRGAIMLVPEISLTRQVISAFIGRFGKENLAVLHSKLTPRERYDEWQRIRSGRARIVIGARMGVFAPLDDLGLIIMDEEHEASYKADMTPKYETVDIALKRLGYHKGVLLLGSATPAVVSSYRAAQGIYQLLRLKERYNKTPLPQVLIADMRQELKKGNTSIFSGLLHEAISTELAAGRQVILLQNRRGYASFVSCRSCGHVMKCPQCGISLTYHKDREKLVCHYCGRAFSLPQKCPQCGSPYIKHFGIGTEQVEEAVQKYFPQAVTDRLDIDALKTRRDLDRILGAFANGRTQVLIGTQLVAKGLDFDNVGLVGVIAADVTLNIPDYRSAERTFQLITQAAGRAGRGERQGRVIIQTYEPEDNAILAAAGHDYESFYRGEIRLRRLLDYPPFSDLIMVNFTAADEETALAFAARCRRFLTRAVPGGSSLKPRISASFKGRDAVRSYILIKARSGSRNEYIYQLGNFHKLMIEEKAACNMDIDVNPYSTY